MGRRGKFDRGKKALSRHKDMLGRGRIQPQPEKRKQGGVGLKGGFGSP